LARQNGNRSTFNSALGRKEPKNLGQQLRNGVGPADKWLAGRPQESKKVFSFKNPPRTFGFVKPDIIDFAAMRERLKSVCLKFQESDFICGSAVLARLFNDGGAP
jgi:CRISPR-associated protein Cmr1